MADKRADQLKEITERLEQGVKDIFTSEMYTKYLLTMSKFHNYSFNNTLLIAMQRPDATLVAGYNAWKNKFNRYVKKGEKGIQIIAPAPVKEREEREKIDKDTGLTVLNESGEPEIEVVERVIPRFRVTTVFDYAQTDGEPLPTLEVNELTARVKDYTLLKEAIEQVSPVPIRFGEIEGNAKGYYSHMDKEICVRADMGESQTIKTMIHEVAHARLSVENGGHETEDSLHTQILQIHNYIRENPELTLTDTYADNGFTGTRFDRPEFERMMQDIRTGKIQCIVVKDLSRFGRDYIETGSYLETIFPMLHVRFIAINDDFDNIRQSDVDSLAVPIKNMVNSLYAKDISKKISLSYQMRREKGIPTSWCTPYGYQLNQQGNKLEATEDAKWVKLIYQWYLAGVSTNEIARRLEFLEVARPNERLNRKLHEGDDPTYNKWHPSTVLRILNSSAYIGELVSGKTQTASYKGIGLHPVEKKEWHIVENAHEAIILKSDFEKVQARREQNKEKREMAMARSKATREKCYNHLSGMVYCGCCRRNMTFERRVHGTVKETHYGVFICKRKKNTTPCAYHAVPEKMLMMVAMDQIHHLVSTMCEEEKLVKDMMRSSNLDSARSIKMKENSILFRIQEAEERRLRLYEDYKAEILDEDEYSQLKEHYIAEKQRLEHELQKQRQRALELEKRIKICDAQMERMRGILNQNEFDEELVHELIKRIYVGMDNSVEVEFKCSDPYQEVLAIMSEVQNE